jgi:hypothetical protein
VQCAAHLGPPVGLFRHLDGMLQPPPRVVVFQRDQTDARDGQPRRMREFQITDALRRFERLLGTFAAL